MRLLDAGPRLQLGATCPEPDRRTWGFKADGGSYDWYRVRAVGGRSWLWGGWCYRFDQRALERAGWPRRARRLAAAYRRVERRLGVVEGLVDERYRRVAEEIGSRALPKRGAMSSPSTAWNATSASAAQRAGTWEVALHVETKGHHATCVETLDLRKEKRRQVRARAIVLAASPVETARILLRSDVDAARWGIGRNFTDHMVASVVLLEPVPPPPRDGRGPFPGAALIENFVNVDDASRQPYRGGFSVEVSGPVSLPSLGIERMVPGAEVDQWSATQVHAMGEVFPDPQRYVDLHPELRDAWDRPVPFIHMGWSDADRAMAQDIKQACISIADLMAVPGSRVIPFHDPLLAGAGHEAGTCMMGDHGAGACNGDGRLRALANVWIADASVMPTPGDRHPSLTLLAHATRVGHAVKRWIASR
ncbi:MAG: GMC family oxidoreductase [Deltaproteobacteria bacterium]|nr:GMC family oxidoreductase [Deltaproteobacteria bacterium]